MSLELVAVAVGQDFNFFSFSATRQSRHSENVLVHIWHLSRSSGTSKLPELVRILADS